MRQLLFLSFLLTHLSLWSQLDQLFLVDGSILMGEILSEDTLGTKFRLNTNQDTILVSQSDIIKKFSNDGSMIFFSKGRYHVVRGHYLQISTGIGPNYGGSFHLNAYYAKRFTPGFSAGFGAGYSVLAEFDHFVNYEFITPHFYGRQYLTKLNKPDRFYLTGKLGYALALGSRSFGLKSYKGGASLEGGFGFQWASKKKTKFSVEFAYYLQKSSAQFGNTNSFFDPGFIDQSSIFFERRIFFRNILRLNADLN
ncbi:MAG: hypothetical protein IPL46_10080 [Saprospiraceae bacterium]|nr:hypothetical protein [Saprospiraceae bacterium]